jgi:hypothetical protein
MKRTNNNRGILNKETKAKMLKASILYMRSSIAEGTKCLNSDDEKLRQLLLPGICNQIP